MGSFYKDIRVDVKVPQNSLFRFVVDEGTGTIRNVRIEDVYINYGGTLGGIIMEQLKRKFLVWIL